MEYEPNLHTQIEVTQQKKLPSYEKVLNRAIKIPNVLCHGWCGDYQQVFYQKVAPKNP